MRRVKFSCRLYRQGLLEEAGTNQTKTVKYTKINPARLSEELSSPVTLNFERREAIYEYYVRSAKRNKVLPVKFADFWDRNVVLQKVK